MLNLESVLSSREQLYGMLDKKTIAVEDIQFCLRCKKRTSPTARISYTGWILNLRRCECAHPELLTEPRTNICASTEVDTTGDATPIPESPELPEMIDDRFEVIEFLGKGGMGTVYRVKDRELQREFALKTLHPDSFKDNAALKRFELEAEAATKLDHPNLVSVYSHGVTKSGEPYILMDYIRGETLADLINRKGAIHEDRAISILNQICSALAHAHQHKIVHRDIKPANVLLSQTESGEDVVRLVDFGISKTLPGVDRQTRDLTQTGAVFGSPHYMSPEQSLGFTLDERSDIYSFGCLMYETLSGAPPFAGNNPIQVVVKHINEDPKPYLRHSPRYKTQKMLDLQAISLRCLRKAPEDRFQSSQELLEQLTLVTHGKKADLVSLDAVISNTIVLKSIEIVSLSISVATGISLFLAFSNFDSVPKHYFAVPIMILVLVLFIAFGILTYSALYYGITALGIRGQLAPKKYWWNSLILFSSVTFVGGLFMFLISAAPSAEGHTVDEALFVAGAAIAILSIASIVASAFGWLLSFFDRRKASLHAITKSAVALTLIVLLSFPIVFREKTATYLASGANSLSYRDKKSTFAIPLVQLAKSMCPGNIQILEANAQINWRMKNYAAAEKQYSELIAKVHNDTEEQISYLRDRARLFTEAGAIDKAIADHTEWIKLQPNSAWAFEERATCLIQKARFREALQDLKISQELYPGDPTTHFLIAKALLGLNEYDLAIDNLNETMKTQRGYTSKAFLIRGYLYEKRGQSSLAQLDYNQALALHQNEKDPYWGEMLAKTATLIQLGKRSEAIAQFKLTQKIDSSYNYYSKTRAQYELKDYPDAIRLAMEAFAPELKKD